MPEFAGIISCACGKEFDIFAKSEGEPAHPRYCPECYRKWPEVEGLAVVYRLEVEWLSTRIAASIKRASA